MKSQLQIWGAMLNNFRFPKEEAVKFGKPVAWEDAKATPIRSFKPIKQLAPAPPSTPIEDIRKAAEHMSQYAPEKYVCYVKCPCGHVDYYTDALNDKFGSHSCVNCGKFYTKAECREAWRRTMDEKFKRLVASCSRTGSQERGQSPAQAE